VSTSSSTLAMPRWPGPVIIVGGVMMAALFPVYSILHGPTSFYEAGEWLGVEGQVWGGLMNGVPSLLIAAGLIGARTVVTGRGGRAVRVGYLMLLAGLLIPGVVDLVLRAIGPPLLMPIEAVGLLLVGLGGGTDRTLSRLSRAALVGMGTLLLLAFLTALIPMDLSDRLNGYRVFGVLAYELVGVAWIIFGAGLVRGAAETPRPIA
jgi:hypothetical protein